jgi:two-component system, NarL family, nitrate/nitrite response regulator NarL
MSAEPRAPGERTIRVLVAENSRIHTRLLADALMHDPALRVFPFESNPADLVTTAIAERINVLVVSSNLDENPSRGLEVVRELRASHPSIRAVLLPDSSKDEAVLQAFRAGARGVFGRNEPMELMVKCVRCVSHGQIWANSRHLSIALDALVNSPTVRAVNADGMNLLSEREIQVVRCLAEGLTNREIAERLELSRHTVKNYFFRIFDKLGVSSRVELLFMCLSHSAAEQPAQQPLVEQGNGGSKDSHHELDFLKKSAEAGLPAAQLALAQMYLTRRSHPKDLVDAYMWYLVATESAIHARGSISRMLTSEQLEEAKHRASVWLAGRNQKTSSSESPLPNQTSLLNGVQADN